LEARVAIRHRRLGGRLGNAIDLGAVIIEKQKVSAVDTELHAASVERDDSRSASRHFVVELGCTSVAVDELPAMRGMRRGGAVAEYARFVTGP
jgi:hypothetical protein